MKNKNLKKISKNKRKKAISLPFEWIFAIFIGAIIIFIAIYAVVYGLGAGNQAANTEVIARLEAYLSPYETGLGSGQTGEIHFSAPSKIFFDQCNENDANSKPFGRQSISFTQEMFKKYQEKGEYVELKSKYVFANESVEGKDFYIASIPFFMGYKVSDIILIYTSKYCFVQAPNEIKEEAEGLQLKNINFSDDMDCKGIKVCFDSNNRNCNINVYPDNEGNYNSGKIEYNDNKGKQIAEVYYIDSLKYGAIFSHEKLYECNVKRLMNKFRELGKVYLEKISIIQMKGCSSNIQGKLIAAMQLADQLESSDNLSELLENLDDIKKSNDAAMEGCILFTGV